MAEAKDVTMERLAALLDAYGAQPARWPAAEREAAEALIARSDAARDAFAEAARLDAALDAAAPPPPADRLAFRLRALMPRRETVVTPAAMPAVRRRAAAWLASPLARAAAVAFAVLGGVGIGLAIPHGSAPETAPATVATAPQGAAAPQTAAFAENATFDDALASAERSADAPFGLALVNPVVSEDSIALADLPLQ
jgi:hypothetical protein